MFYCIKHRLFDCSRWLELGSTIQYLASLAEASNSQSEFIFLNNNRTPFYVGFQDKSGNKEQLNQYLKNMPQGGTPLCSTIRNVIEKIKTMEPMLRTNNKKALLVIATDGEASDGDVAQAMRPLKYLPVYVVVRLYR